MDRAYLDFYRLYNLNKHFAFFVIPLNSNTKFRRLYSHKVDKSTGLRYDQTIVLTGINSREYYPDKLRRVKYYDAITGKRLSFLTNNFVIPALRVADLYKCRWQVELLF